MAAKKYPHNRVYNSLPEFYQAIGNYINNPLFFNITHERPSWFGLSNIEIEEAKNGYTAGMDVYNSMPDPELQGSGGYKYQYNDTDGDDLNMDRFFDGLPAISKRTRVNGTNTGRFTDIYINVGESCIIEFQEMLYKTYAATRIIDSLESQNIRCAVYVVCFIKLHNKNRDTDFVKIKIKDYNESVVIPIMLNAISPWFFRKHILGEITGKFKTTDGIGWPIDIPDKQPENIYIETGQCLSFEDATRFINNLNIN